MCCRTQPPVKYSNVKREIHTYISSYLRLNILFNTIICFIYDNVCLRIGFFFLFCIYFNRHFKILCIMLYVYMVTLILMYGSMYVVRLVPHIMNMVSIRSKRDLFRWIRSNCFCCFYIFVLIS